MLPIKKPVLLAGVAVVVCLGLGLWWAVSELRETEREAGATECQRDVAVDVNQGNEQVRQRQRAADLKRIAELEAEIAQLKADSRAAWKAHADAKATAAYWKEQYDDVYSTDEAAREWRDDPLPDGILACVHRDEACDAHRPRGSDADTRTPD